MEQLVFREVIGHFATGVTVITSRHDDTNYGLTASAVTSLTLEPPMILVCVNKNTGTQDAISRSHKFAVNILDEDQAELAYKFAKPKSNKFEGVDYYQGIFGEPLLSGALAHLECRVAAETEAGTHKVFMAEVDKAEAGVGAPLTYFRGKFGRFELVQDEATYRGIRDLVLSRDLTISETLDPTTLASEFNASRSSVFYALTRLTSEGLIQRDLVKGYVIKPIDVKVSEDAFNARCAIELGVADMTVGHLSSEELAELRKRMEATVPLVASNHFVDFDRYVATNTAFHEYLVSLAKSQSLLDAYRRLSIDGIMWRLIGRILPNFNQASDELTADHRHIVEAFEKGDVEQARQAIIHHNEDSKQTNNQAIEAAGGRV